MGKAFQAWSLGLTQQQDTLAVGMKMVWRNWYDLEAVQTAVNQHGNATLIQLFTEYPPPTNVFDSITHSYNDFAAISNQVEQTLQFACAQNNSTYSGKLSGLRDML